MPDTIAELIQAAKQKYVGRWFCGVPVEWVDNGWWWCAEGHRDQSITLIINGARWLETEPKLHHKGFCRTCRKPVMLGPKDLPVLEP